MSWKRSLITAPLHTQVVALNLKTMEKLQLFRGDTVLLKVGLWGRGKEWSWHPRTEIAAIATPNQRPVARLHGHVQPRACERVMVALRRINP